MRSSACCFGRSSAPTTPRRSSSLASTAAGERPRSKRFMPRSKSVAEPYRPSSSLLRRVSVLGVAMLVIFAVLLLRLWALQVLSGTKYVSQAAANSFRTVRVQAPRGQILEQRGAARDERSRDRDRAVARRPSEGVHSAVRGTARARAPDACPALRDRRRDQGAAGEQRPGQDRKSV